MYCNPVQYLCTSLQSSWSSIEIRRRCWRTFNKDSQRSTSTHVDPQPRIKDQRTLPTGLLWNATVLVTRTAIISHFTTALPCECCATHGVSVPSGLTPFLRPHTRRWSRMTVRIRSAPVISLRIIVLVRNSSEQPVLIYFLTLSLFSFCVAVGDGHCFGTRPDPFCTKDSKLEPFESGSICFAYFVWFRK